MQEISDLLSTTLTNQDGAEVEDELEELEKEVCPPPPPSLPTIRTVPLKNLKTQVSTRTAPTEISTLEIRDAPREEGVVGSPEIPLSPEVPHSIPRWQGRKSKVVFDEGVVGSPGLPDAPVAPIVPSRFRGRGSSVVFKEEEEEKKERRGTREALPA